MKQVRREITPGNPDRVAPPLGPRLEREARHRLLNLLREAGLSALVEEPVGKSGPPRADLVVRVETPAGRRRLVIEVKGSGQPRALAEAGERLKRAWAKQRGWYAVVIAPFVSDSGRAVCREIGVGCVDLAGNAFLAFGGLFVERRGYPNPWPSTRGLRSAFAPKASRVLRVLLEDPGREWYVRDLAGAARVSLGETSLVKRLLLGEDLLREQGKRFRLANPEALLRAWSERYRYDRNTLEDFYSSLSVRELEGALGAACEQRGIAYALTMFSGAERVSPFTRYNRAFAYVAGAVEEVRDALGLKAVPSGANLVLLRPYDEGVLYGLRELGGLKVVSDVQLYLDLRSYRGRGEEAAEFLYEQVIRPKWQEA